MGWQILILYFSWRDTEIGDQTKIDNLVQVGLYCLICVLAEKMLRDPCAVILLCFADRSQCCHWEVLHHLWASWHCWFSNVCLYITLLPFLIKVLQILLVNKTNHRLTFGNFSIKDYVTFGGRVAVRDHVSIVSKVCYSTPSSVHLIAKLAGIQTSPVKHRVCLVSMCFPCKVAVSAHNHHTITNLGLIYMHVYHTLAALL